MKTRATGAALEAMFQFMMNTRATGLVCGRARAKIQLLLHVVWNLVLMLVLVSLLLFVRELA
jgi:hypothetical protein